MDLLAGTDSCPTQGSIDHLIPPTPGTEVRLVKYDGSWTGHFNAHRNRIASALGRPALLHHVGSTAVPGLTAKPVIDILLLLDDPDDEAAYVPALEGAGYTFALRETGWHRHRLLRAEQPIRVNLHVLPVECAESARMLAFRDRLRQDQADHDRYEQVKLDLAAQSWDRVQDYADAKSAVVQEILGRALLV